MEVDPRFDYSNTVLLNNWFTRAAVSISSSFCFYNWETDDPWYLRLSLGLGGFLLMDLYAYMRVNK